MAAPPFLKKASKRRLDAALPTSNKATDKSKVATFKNPGYKAGKGLTQKRKMEGADAASEGSETGDTLPENPLDMLKGFASKKSKTKVQPAAARKVAAMKLAKKR